MLPKIKQFFESHFIADNKTISAEEQQHSMQLAIAALLIEVAESDFEHSDKEHDALLEVVSNTFDLKENKSETLIQLAKEAHQNSTDYFQFTSLINQHYSAEERIKLIEKLWEIAFADKVLHKYEEHVIRRIADLLYVSHSDFMASKLRVMNKN